MDALSTLFVDWRKGNQANEVVLGKFFFKSTKPIQNPVGNSCVE